MKQFDIAVIGAGPAGSFSAYLLAQEGFNVCLFEKKTFPRETLCGEFLSYEVSNHLKDVGLFEKFLDLKPNKITSFRLFTPNDSITSSLKFTAFGLKRSTLDDFLLNEAESAGVTVFQPCSVTYLNKQNDSFIISADSPEGGKEIKAKLVINASGKRSSIDKILNRSFQDKPSNYNGVKIHLKKELLNNFDCNEIHIYTGKDLYCGVNKVEGENVTLCFLERRRLNDPSVRQKFISLKTDNPAFGELLSESADDAIRSAKVYGTGAIYFGKKEVVQDGVFMIGDSAGIIAPLAGDGIGMAIESARLISELLSSNIKNNTKSDEIMLKYDELWKKKFRRRLFTAGMIQKVIFSIMLTPGLKLLKKYPRSISTLIDYTRK